MYCKSAPVTHIDPDGTEALRWPPKDYWQPMTYSDLSKVYTKNTDGRFEGAYRTSLRSNISTAQISSGIYLKTQDGKTTIKPDAIIYQTATEINIKARPGNIPKVDIDFEKGVTIGEVTTANKSSGTLTRSSKGGQFQRYLTYFQDLQDQNYEAIRFDLVTPSDMNVSDLEDFFEGNDVFFRHYVPYYKKGKGENEVLIDFRYRMDFYIDYFDKDQVINKTPVSAKSETDFK